MRRAWFVGLLVLAPTLVGCSSPQESYCSALEDEQQTLADLAESSSDPGSGALAKTIDVFEGLRAEAPEDVQDEWDTFIAAWQTLESKLEDAGADESMFTDGTRPDGMSEDDYQAISGAAAKLRSTRVVEAASGIEQHALDVCKLDLGGSGLTP